MMMRLRDRRGTVWSRERRTGVTLPEIMIAMTILGLVMTAALTLFIPSLGRFATADTTYDAERHAMLALRMMAADLKESSFAELWMANGGGTGSGPSPTPAGPAPPGLLIPTPRDASGAWHRGPDGLPNYQQGYYFYWSQPEDPPTNGYRLFRAYLTDRRAAAPGVPGRMVATGLSGVTVSLGGAAGMGSGLVVQVDGTTLAQTTPGGRGKVRLHVGTIRFLKELPTTFEGDKTVDLPY